MSQHQVIDVDPENVDDDGICANQNSTGASLTLNGALVSGGVFTSADGLGRQLCFTDTDADDQRGATYVVVGTDPNGNAQTESLAGPNTGATVETTKYFLTVSSISITSPVAGSKIKVGTVDECATPVYPLNYQGCHLAALGAVATGTLNYTVQHCFQNIMKDGTASLTFFDHSTIATQTGNKDGNYIVLPSGIRVIFNSFTDGAELQLYILQQGS